MTDTQETTYWVRNLSPDISIFSGSTGKFRLEGNGFVGSVTQIDKRLAFDPFVKRAISRGRLEMLDEGAAMEAMGSLHIREEGEDHLAPMMENLAAGASEKVGRYRRTDLPDEAEARRSLVPGDVWAKDGVPHQTPAPQVTRAKAEVVDSPILDSSSVLTERVREGEAGWESQS
jgi:hypothetical protein